MKRVLKKEVECELKREVERVSWKERERERKRQRQEGEKEREKEN